MTRLDSSNTSVMKVLMMLEDLMREINDFEDDEVEEVNLDFYLDEISREISKIALKAFLGDKHTLDLLQEEMKNLTDIDSPINQMLIDAFMLNLSITDTLAIHDQDKTTRDFEDWMLSLMNERVFKEMVYGTARLAIERNTFSAIILTSKVFSFGLMAIMKGNFRALGRALDYYMLLTLKLYDPEDIGLAPLKFSLYISHLILSHTAILKGRLIEDIEHYRREARARTKVANLVDRYVKTNNIPSISMAIGKANRIAARLSMKSIKQKNDWILMKELNELYWMASEIRSEKNLEELRALQNNIEATIHVINTSKLDMDLAQDIVEEKFTIETEEEQRDASIGLTASAIKLHSIGLKDHSKRIEDFMKSLSLQKGSSKIHQVNIDFLKYIKEESDRKRGLKRRSEF